MRKSVINSAAAKLEFRDLVLDSASLTRSENSEPLLYPPKIRQRSSLGVSTEELAYVDVDSNEFTILRAFVRFEINGYTPGADPGKEDDAEPLFCIKAAYRVEYRIKEVLSDEELDAFAEFNAVHNAWPFWRQHVFTTVGTAKLPNLSVPLFRHVPGTKKQKKDPRKPAASVVRK